MTKPKLFQRRPHGRQTANVKPSSPASSRTGAARPFRYHSLQLPSMYPTERK